MSVLAHERGAEERYPPIPFPGTRYMKGGLKSFFVKGRFELLWYFVVAVAYVVNSFLPNLLCSSDLLDRQVMKLYKSKNQWYRPVF